jgi:hypothetical protein
MSDLSELPELNCTCAALAERVRYFPRQLLTADDLSAEQDYQHEQRRRHQRFLHGWGVVCGCEVIHAQGGDAWQVIVRPGFAVSPAGDDIYIDAPVTVDLRNGAQDQPCTVQTACPPLAAPPAAEQTQAVLYVAARYGECYARPVRVAPAGCGCDDTACEYSRIRERFEIKVLTWLPQSHRVAAQQDADWRNDVLRATQDHGKQAFVFPVPPCTPCPADPWVVLATIKPRQNDGQWQLPISFDDRRVLLSAQRVQEVAALLVGR